VVVAEVVDVVADVEALDVATVVDVVVEVLDAVELDALVEDAVREEEEDVAEVVDPLVPDVEVPVAAVATLDVDAAVVPPVCPAPPLLVFDWVEHAPAAANAKVAINARPRFTVSERLTVGGSGEWDIRDPARAYIVATSVCFLGGMLLG